MGATPQEHQFQVGVSWTILSLRMPAVLHDQARAAAEDEERSLSALIRVALREHLERAAAVSDDRAVCGFRLELPERIGNHETERAGGPFTAVTGKSPW